MKRKELETRIFVPQWKKKKVIKDVAIQALAKEDFEKIDDQVKVARDGVFQHATYHQEEMYKQMQEHMDELHQFLEETNITACPIDRGWINNKHYEEWGGRVDNISIVRSSR
jgi:hypothetical protein